MVSAALWGSFCNMNLLYEIYWTGHVWRLFQLIWSKIKKIKKLIIKYLKIIENIKKFRNIKKYQKKILLPGFQGSPTLSPQLTIGFELETFHLTLNTLTNSPYLEFDKQRNFFFLHIHLSFYPLLKHIKPLTLYIFLFPSYTPHTPKHINISSLFVSATQIFQIPKHIHTPSYF